MDTAGKMVYQLRKDAEVLGRLEMGMWTELRWKAFSVSVLAGENPVFSASIVPVVKEPILPFDISNAVSITPEMIGMLIQSLMR